MSRDAILVTGASGFIGGHLVRELEQRGYMVYQHGHETGNIASCPLEFDGVRHVFHLAGKTFVPDSWDNPRDFYEVNVLGAVNLLEFCRRRSVSATVISSYVYGKPNRLPIREDHPLEPLNPYAHSKILVEAICAYYQAQFKVPVIIVRPFNIYGPGQNRSFLIPTLIRQALDPAADRIVVADLRPRRDYIYVQDFIALLMATMDCPVDTVFNAGSGKSVSIEDLVTLINSMIPQPKPVHSTDQFRPEEVLDVVADISRAGDLLNWHPTTPLLVGLRRTLEWMRAQE